MPDLSSTQKGAAAEAEIAAAAIRLGLIVLQPFGDGSRYDLIIDTGRGLLRVQCKWGSRQGDVIVARCLTSRHTPNGYRRTTYSADEVDAIAVYSPDTDRCYLLPVHEVEDCTTISLRLGPTRNNQALNIRWASDYLLATAVGQPCGHQPSQNRRDRRHS